VQQRGDFPGGEMDGRGAQRADERDVERAHASSSE
jgi:hypothetical protein